MLKDYSRALQTRQECGDIIVVSMALESFTIEIDGSVLDRLVSSLQVS